MDLDTKAFISSEGLIKLEPSLLYFYTMLALAIGEDSSASIVPQTCPSSCSASSHPPHWLTADRLRAWSRLRDVESSRISEYLTLVPYSHRPAGTL